MTVYSPIALVTGGAKRLGRAFCEALIDRGYGIAVHYRESCDSAAELVERAKAKGVGGIALKADLANESQVQALIEKARESLGPLSLLINCAASFIRDSAEDFEIETWNQQIATNLQAPAILARDFARQFPKDNVDSGLIINMLDCKVARPNSAYYSYTASKMGLAALTEIQAQAYAPRIRVNGIAPGLTLKSGPMDDSDFEAIHDHNILKRGAGLDDQVKALFYLLDSPAVTGQTLFVDGGDRLTPNRFAKE